jgi:hypothetical protein
MKSPTRNLQNLFYYAEYGAGATKFNMCDEKHLYRGGYLFHCSGYT